MKNNTVKNLAMVLVSVLLGAGIMMIPGLPREAKWVLVIAAVIASGLLKKALRGGAAN
jgi:hypothetical protein